MIRFEGVTVTYPGTRDAALRDLTATVEEGALCLVVGPTGSGKSTLLGAACARVPHTTGGHLAGRVAVAGRDTRTHRPRDLADLVGVVGQDPLAGFVADVVEDELAFGMEQLGLPAATMRKRVEEVLDLLGIASLRRRPLADLSGGEQQRVALGAVLTAQPRVLILDEPTSALDPTAAEEVLAAITRLVHDLGITVLLAEHRLERVVQFADQVIALQAGGTAVTGDPRTVLLTTPSVPPVVELGRLSGWEPLPLSVREARRHAGPLREALRTAPAPLHRNGAGDVALAARALHVHHGPVHAVRGVDLDVRRGQVLAVMGRNGSGKSSLLWALQGQGPRSGGSVRLDAPGVSSRRGHLRRTNVTDPAAMSPEEARRHVALVPQTPSDLIYLETVRAECRAADLQAGVASGTASGLLATLVSAVPPDAHPRDLSEGQRLALALAIQLAATPAVVLLDEPTRGLDREAKAKLGALLRDIAAGDRAVVLASHDVEFVAAWADRVLVLGEGDVVADGSAREVLVASPTFAPQVAKVLRPLEFLTVADVAAALAAP